jgi:pimeloyl-ACP methyl ester carboxylesterase
MTAITEANVVTVNYRLGFTDAETIISNSDNSRTRPFYRYPSPVHDTLAGLDWVLQTLRPEQLFVFGSNIGGSLATMLSLTESQHIHGVAAHEPVCDWTGLDDYCTIGSEILIGSGSTIGDDRSEVIMPEGDESQPSPAQPAQTKQPSKHRKKAAPFDLAPLLNTRKYLFETPSKYFDSFASPMLFLRSAGKDVPKIMPEYLTGPEYPVPVLKTPVTEEELIDLWDIQMHIKDESKSTESATPVEERPSRRRKALSRWPPYGLDAGNDGGSSRFMKPTRLQITLPWVRFFARLGSSDESNDAVTTSIEHESASKPRANSRRSATENNSVLAMQAKDMVSVMRRACFWGEEAGNGEERVTLRNVTQPTTVDSEQRQLTDPNYLETIHESANWFKDLMSNPR